MGHLVHFDGTYCTVFTGATYEWCICGVFSVGEGMIAMERDRLGWGYEAHTECNKKVDTSCMHCLDCRQRGNHVILVIYKALQNHLEGFWHEHRS